MNAIPSELQTAIREAVRAELIDLLGIEPTQKIVGAKRYYPTDEAWKILGFRNKRALYNTVSSGLLRVGAEVQDRRSPDSQYASYYFDIERCRKRLSELPEKRRKNF